MFFMKLVSLWNWVLIGLIALNLFGLLYIMQVYNHKDSPFIYKNSD